jgi:hypothetical protein
MTAEEVAAAIRSGEMVIIPLCKGTSLLDDHFPLVTNSLPVLQKVLLVCLTTVTGW